jgi:competence protein ComEA
VVNPGVYELPGRSRVEDAIVAAGGLTSEADEERIALTLNRAANLVDGAKLYIPKTGESTAPVTSYNLESQSPLVHINFASQSELEALPGVGPVTAQKIIAGRPYQTLDELVSKKAVGQSLFEKIKPQLAL